MTANNIHQGSGYDAPLTIGRTRAQIRGLATESSVPDHGGEEDVTTMAVLPRDEGERSVPDDMALKKPLLVTLFGEVDKGAA